MKEVLSDIAQWQADNVDEGIALATVVQTWGSAPRRVGAKMALRPSGTISGSVSGGCVEGAVFEAGCAVLESKQSQLLHFGVADETAWEVGLACGGIIEVFVEPLAADAYTFVRDLITKDEAGAAVTIIQGPAGRLGEKLVWARDGRWLGSLGDLDEAARAVAVAAKKSGRVWLRDEVEVFVDVYRPAPTLIMVGGVHIAIALTSMAKTVGYRTIVVDPRRAFGSESRFPHVDQLIQAWPQKAFEEIALTPETAVALLTHDPKIDDPALKVILEAPVFYIGALGSRRTHGKRIQRLMDMGFNEVQIDRIQAPIGLSIGAKTPEEIALSVMAQIVQAQRS